MYSKEEEECSKANASEVCCGRTPMETFIDGK